MSTMPDRKQNAGPPVSGRRENGVKAKKKKTRSKKELATKRETERRRRREIHDAISALDNLVPRSGAGDDNTPRDQVSVLNDTVAHIKFLEGGTVLLRRANETMAAELADARLVMAALHRQLHGPPPHHAGPLRHVHYGNGAAEPQATPKATAVPATRAVAVAAEAEAEPLHPLGHGPRRPAVDSMRENVVVIHGRQSQEASGLQVDVVDDPQLGALMDAAGDISMAFFGVDGLHHDDADLRSPTPPTATSSSGKESRPAVGSKRSAAAAEDHNRGSEPGDGGGTDPKRRKR